MQMTIPLLQLENIEKVFRAGRKQVEKETQEWERMTAILARFLSPKEGLA
jgi:hypothetical protein